MTVHQLMELLDQYEPEQVVALEFEGLICSLQEVKADLFHTDCGFIITLVAQNPKHESQMQHPW